MRPPWHLWGNQKPLHLVMTAGFSSRQSLQLLNVTYKRPDTWSWLFWYEVVRCDTPNDPGSIALLYNLTLGIGTTKVTLGTFVQFVLTPLPGPHLGYRTTTTASGDSFVGDLPAQDIVLEVTSIITGAAPGTSCDINVGAIVAPKSHIRPDWFEGHFDGEETGGK